MGRAFWPVVRIVVVLVLAAVVYVFVIPVTHLDTARLSQLVVTKPGVRGLTAKAESSSSVPSISEPFAAEKSAAALHPDTTGAYSVEWSSAKNSTNGVEILAEQLPTADSARLVEAQADAKYLKTTSFKTEGLAYSSKFVISSIPGARTAIFKKPATKSVKAAVEVVAVYRVHQAVAVVILTQQRPSTTPTRSTETTLAIREDNVLRSLGPKFSLAVTTLPTLATIVFVLIACLTAAAAALVPLLVRRTQQRRRERHLARERRQYSVRGSKVLKRHASRPLQRSRPRRRSLTQWLMGR